MFQKKLLHWIACVFATGIFLPCAMFAQTQKTAPTATAASDEVVTLPTLTVTANRIIPPPEPWRYMVVQGIEVLSNASDTRTKQLMTDFVQYKDVVANIQSAFNVKNAPPLKIIICGRAGAFDQFIPEGQPKNQVTVWYKDAEQSFIVVNAADETINVDDERSGVGDASAAIDTLGPQTVADVTGDTSTTDDGSGDTSGDTTDSTDTTPAPPQTPGIHLDLGEQMNRAFLQMRFSQLSPVPPAWFEEGMVQLFQRMHFNGNVVTFAEIKEMTSNDNPDVARDIQDFNAELSATRLIPLGDLFAVTRDSDTYKGAGVSTWAQECQAFVHYCLYGRRSKQLQVPLMQFVQKASVGPVDETLFKQLFKESYKDMLLDLRNYTQNTDAKYQQYTFKEDTRPALGEIRDAKDPEVGRMKGDALILADKPDLGRAELLGPYTRHRTDPDLLGALGLNELTMGTPEKGQILLENAVKGNIVNPRVYVVLGRLYLAQWTTDANEGKKLTPDQVDKIYKLTLTARSQPPALPATYGLLAEALTAAGQPPTLAQLKMLWEGCATYPGYQDLFYDTANLFRRVNDKPSVQKLAAFAAGKAQTPEDKQRFEALVQYASGK